MDQPNHPPAIFLMGPTASGKTGLSIQLAESLGAEIVSVDSALVYRGMDIGTAKPTVGERRGIPHHLLDILDPSEAFSTGQFRTRALEAMAEIVARGNIPLLTGGTMLYFNALSHGLAELPPADAAVRAELDRELERSGSAALHRKLAEIDSESAARIHPNDPQRLQRALEVYRLTGRTISELIREAESRTIPYRIVKLIVAPADRKLLHDAIAQRFHRMLDIGFVDEVDKLLQRGDLSEKMPSIRAVGYRQIWAYLQGEYDYSTMVEKGIVATRQLAKRQFTWLRRETDAQILSSGGPNNLTEALRIIDERLGRSSR
ncbi:MAG: tRNA (adenosine(37)-N6)-dimethylallyltransferase MiaA [Methylomicrobium sp.]